VPRKPKGGFVKQRLFALILAALILGAPAARADGILPYGSGSASWSSWNTADLGPALYSATTHFWNNSSNDTGECNIGYWITGTPGCTTPAVFLGFQYDFYSQSPNLTAADYFGAGASTFFFEDTGQAVQVTLDLQIAKWARTGENTLGWFQLDGLGGGVLFDSGFDGLGNQRHYLGDTTTFDPTGAWALYVTSPRGTFSSTDVDTVTGANHFAAFRVDPLTGRYFIGVEDNVAGQGGDFDFNDIVIEVQNVPEPGTLLLMALGMSGFAAAARRRQKK